MTSDGHRGPPRCPASSSRTRRREYDPPARALSMSWARIGADLVVIFHASYVAFVGLGMVAIVAGLANRRAWARHFWFRVLHLSAILVVVLLSVAGMSWPITLAENSLRRAAGQASYPGAFIGYWAHRLIFFDAPPLAFN